MEKQFVRKKGREIRAMEAFAELYKDFPKGQFLDSFKEQPDFIHVGENKIGIELTRIYVDDIGDGSKMKKQETERRVLGEKIVEKIKKYHAGGFVLHIHFSYHHELEKERKPEIIKLCTIACLDVLFNQGDGYYVIENLPWIPVELPKEIDSISLHVEKKLEEGYYSEGAGAAIPNMQDKHLSVCLMEKNERLKKYSPCDEYWLVIEEGTFAADSFGKIEVTVPVQSDFDKVFLFRRGKGEIIMLR